MSWMPPREGLEPNATTKIAMLEAKIERLRAALTEISTMDRYDGYVCARIAKAALVDGPELDATSKIHIAVGDKIFGDGEP